jgi:poly(3-hydroxybutyrate) depolymerase
MLSLLACNRPLSRRISSFAAISAAFYDDQSSTSPWAEEACEFGRRPIPLMEIHGNRDTRWGYWPPGIEGEVQGLGPVGWLDVWKGRQNCGEKEGDPRPAEVSNATYISKLENGGLSEGVEFAGGAVRVAYRCDKSGSSAKEKTEVGKEDPDMRDVSTLTLLHYSLRDIGYGWPRLDLQREEKIKVNGHEAFPPGDVHFDATKLILEWFETHPLPNKDEIWRQAKELLVERGGKIKTYPKVDEGGEKVGKAMTKDEGEVVEKEEEGEKVRKEAERGSERWRDEL